jgi:hypothetical protein
MTTDKQKNEELHFANQLACHLDDIWCLEVPPDEREWPDLVVSTKSESFGLEVSKVFKESTGGRFSLKQQEAFALNKISELNSEYNQKSEIPIQVSFHGNVESPNIVSKLIGFTEQIGIDEYKCFDEYPDFTVYIWRLPEGAKGGHWRYVPNHVGSVEDADTYTLEEVVKRKSENLSKYTTHVDSCRLLLVADRYYNSGKLNFEKVDELACHGFSHVYLLSSRSFDQLYLFSNH